jgi:hypothetical protein
MFGHNDGFRISSPYEVALKSRLQISYVVESRSLP